MNINTGLLRIFGSVTFLFMIFTIGCRPPVPAENPPNGVKEIQPTGFAWDTMRRAPRWRFTSPIQWHRTGEIEAVLEESRSTGNPILCYVTRFDSDLTATIEDGLFVADVWGQKIVDNFVAWEIDWWEDPELAQSLLGNISAPALFMLIPSPDESAIGFGVTDMWHGPEILSFPLHEGILPLGNPEAAEKLASYREAGWDKIFTIEAERFDVEPDEFVEEQFDLLKTALLNGEGLYPEECLYILYNLPDDDFKAEVAGRIRAWGSYLESIGPDIAWMPDEAYVSGSGWTIDPNRNLQCAICAVAVGDEWAVDEIDSITALRKLLVLEDGNFGGGFPAYFDVRSTFEEGPAYLGDEADVPSSPDALVILRSPMNGPRDITWVNARMLAMLLRLVNAYPEISELALEGEGNVGAFVDNVSRVMIESLMERAGDPAEMSFMDRVFILDLLNQAYQRTADISLLESGGEIASTFSPEDSDEWFDPRMFQFLPDLAIALHQYGWLAENEGARKAADFITEEGTAFAKGFGLSDQRRLAFAYDIVHAKCLHSGVIASLDDEMGRDMLREGLRGWDPGKISQILDPERDLALIELKGYAKMDEAATFLCIDDICYMPSFDVETLAETIQQAYIDLASE